jgi:bacillithiol synthase
MIYSCSSLPYKSTHFFSKLVEDYTENDEKLTPFYNVKPIETNIDALISKKQKSYTQRETLVNYFKKKYTTLTPQQQQSLDNLAFFNCFTITTAHQPNIFTGPLYFIYKIVHTIKIADELNKKSANEKFVPIFFMGSEDADLEELGAIEIQHKKLQWQTNQTGAVGRMKVDKNFIALIQEIEGQIAVNPFGSSLIQLFKECYVIDANIQDCTFNLINKLFGKYGLLVLVPDDALLKKNFEPIIQKELLHQFSAPKVTETVNQLNTHYKVKQTGRELNLFYLIDNKRERIIKEKEKYRIDKLDLFFTRNEILAELSNFPERFSANVILRPVFQEFILPNIIFVGGGGELTYWLQLKKVFEEVEVDYPMLVLRNSFMLYTAKQSSKLNKMGISIESLFEPYEAVFKNLVVRNTQKSLSVEENIVTFKNEFERLKDKANQIDTTLVTHIEALQKQAVKKVEALEEKFLRAEKRNHQVTKQQLLNIYNDLFHKQSLQERNENFAFFFSVFGESFIEMIIACSQTLEQKFTLICLESTT